MTFPETVVFDFALLRLEEAMKTFLAPAPDPLPCDRWLARSCLQKAIRRGEVTMAHRAASALLNEDAKSVWRHMVIIALEDVGVAQAELVEWLVAAARNRQWRAAHGEWRTISFLVEALARSQHCQAVCDLLMLAENAPRLQTLRANAADAEAHALTRQLRDPVQALEGRAVAALALAGQLASYHRDPGRVIGCLAEAGCASKVLATSHVAWLTTRNPMALLFPLIWQAWEAVGTVDLANDDLPFSHIITGIPDYAVDRFTRAGGMALRKFITREPWLQSMLDGLAVRRCDQWKVLGDVLFVIEGGLVRKRSRWSVGDKLRSPIRPLAGIIQLGEQAERVIDWLRPRLATLSGHREHTLTSGMAASRF